MKTTTFSLTKFLLLNLEKQYEDELRNFYTFFIEKIKKEVRVGGDFKHESADNKYIITVFAEEKVFSIKLIFNYNEGYEVRCCWLSFLTNDNSKSSLQILEFEKKLIGIEKLFKKGSPTWTAIINFLKMNQSIHRIPEYGEA